MKTQIITVYHKSGSPIINHPDYLPVQSGKATATEDLRIQGDDEGENISRESLFSEFRCLYWAWKNLSKDVDIVGWSHYRRFFDFHHITKTSDWCIFLPGEYYSTIDYSVPTKIIDFVKGGGVLLTRERIFDMPLDMQFVYFHGLEMYSLMMEAVKAIHGEDTVDSYKEYLRSHTAMTSCCMFVATRKIFDEYCEWLFPVLFYCNEKMESSRFDAYQSRAVAFIGERLFAYYFYNKEQKGALKTKTIPVLAMNQNLDAKSFKFPTFKDNMIVSCINHYKKLSFGIWNTCRRIANKLN